VLELIPPTPVFPHKEGREKYGYNEPSMPSGAHSYPDQLEIRPLTKPPSIAVSVPGSKSITNRALVLGTLLSFNGSVELIGALRSEDTELMVEALRALGFRVQTDWPSNPPVLVLGPYRFLGDEYPPYPAEVYVGNSGTTMRFLTALVTLGNGRFRLDGVPRMRERPIDDLLDALRQVGVHAYSERGNGCPPVVLEANRFWVGDRIRIKGNVSSQFLSALLMVAPLACPGTDSFTIEVDGPLVSAPYVEMTVKMVRQWGLPIFPDGTEFKTCHAGAHGYQLPVLDRYAIEPDASAASYFFAAAAITGGRVTVRNLPENSLQGDVRFVDLLAQMGCQVEKGASGITVRGRHLRGIDVDMNDISDTVMTLAAVACFAEGPTTIRNVGHIRHKETDRLSAIATELRKVGANVEEAADGLTITPGPLRGAAINTYNDHRMAMSMALIGLKVAGVVIRDPGCVAKTYPAFWEDLEKLRE
jgi:3-phosphoshikimate 1-carboxyvinyltransferase